MVQVSVVIPTYNRLSRLKQVLAAFERQTCPQECFEIVVVSDGATDGTDDYLRQLETPLTVVPVLQTNQGVAVARNRGVEHARGELIVFIDDDVVPEPHLITEHIRSHEEEQGDVVVLGPMLTPPGFPMKPWVRWEQAMLAKQYEAMASGRWRPTARQFYTGNASLARRQVLEAGGFDSRFRRAEDVELAYRLAERGVRFVSNSRAVGYHYADRSFRSWMETPYAYGRNDIIFARDKGQHWLLPTIPREFQQRNPLIKLLVKLCLGREALSQTAISSLKLASGLGNQLGMERVVEMTHSSIFNLRYYQGVADELGGREHFLAKVH